MKSTKVQTLGVLMRVRDIANDDMSTVYVYVRTYVYVTWSNIMRMRIFRGDKMGTTGIRHMARDRNVAIVL